MADFTFSATRVAAEGYFIAQPVGGTLFNVLPYNENYYCIHKSNVWRFIIESDDVTVSNEIFRNHLGSTNWRACYATGDGVYFIDNNTPTEPRFCLFTLQISNNEVVPVIFSYNLDLSKYNFDSSTVFEWGDYICFSCRTSDSSVNNRLILYNKLWKSFDICEYFTSVLDSYSGYLWAGDSATNNVMQLFTDFSANGYVIKNYWEGKLTDLDIDELKKFKKLTVTGQIGRDQDIKVSLNYDGDGFVEIGTINGDGSYVSRETAGTIASPQIGEGEVGGGGSGIEAFDYTREFKVNSQKFSQVKIRFEAQGVGYASVSEINFNDIKKYGQKNLLRFRTT